MERELFGRLERGHTRQVRRHRLVAAASIVVLAAGGIAGVQIASVPAISHNAYCYASADAKARVVQASRPTENNEGESAAEIMSDRVAQANADCLLAWNAGIFGDSGKVITVPPLQTCVRNDQIIAVLPNTAGTEPAAFCTSVGMNAP